jgi:hypothetical protein
MTLPGTGRAGSAPAEAVMLGLDAESSGRVLGKTAGAVRTAAYRGLRRQSSLPASARSELGWAKLYWPWTWVTMTRNS